MTAIPRIAVRQLTWHKPRGCYRKCYRKKVYYLRGDGSRQDTQANYETALQEWAVTREQADGKAQDLGVAFRVSETVELIEQLTEDFRSSANRKFPEVGLPVLAPRKTLTGALAGAGDLYLNDVRAKAMRQEISVGRYEHVAGYLKKFLDYFGRNTDANAITESDLQGFRAHVTSRIKNGKDNAISDYTARYTLESAGGFVEWLWVQHLLLDLPRNIKIFKKVKVAKRPVKFFTVEQVKAIWNACENDWQRLMIALALNTAMNQADMARLAVANLQPPHVILRRGKTGVLACWKLWTVTQRLIETLKNPKAKKAADLLFMTREGRPLVERGFRKDGRTFKNDAVHQVFKRVLKKAGVDGKFVMLRKTVATTLKANGYGDVVQFFLSHETDALFLSNGVVTKEPSNISVAETFYVGEDAKIQALKNHPRLLEALKVLEKVFGLEEPQQ